MDFDDNGLPDSGLVVSFHLPGYGVYPATSFTPHPEFSGFGNPDVFDDLALLYFADPLPELAFPALGLNMQLAAPLMLAGFGRSGYGNYGYTTDASLTDRRIGYNLIDSFVFETNGDGVLFRYDFDVPDTYGIIGGSLGNDLETIIGPGDSGGPALVTLGDSHALVGINTFTEGYGGRFGDIGGGVVLEPYWDWISETTGLTIIPEPATIAFWLGLSVMLSAVRRPRNSCRSWQR